MLISRSVPQHTAQIFSPFAGQERPGLRFSHIGQSNRFLHSYSKHECKYPSNTTTSDCHPEGREVRGPKDLNLCSKQGPNAEILRFAQRL